MREEPMPQARIRVTDTNLDVLVPYALTVMLARCKHPRSFQLPGRVRRDMESVRHGTRTFGCGLSEEYIMPFLEHITVNPNQCGGRPCIRGMRIRVEDILELLAAGASREEIFEDYPYLESEDITVALAFAARQMDHPVLRATRRRSRFDGGQ